MSEDTRNGIVADRMIVAYMSFANESEPLPVFLSHQLVLPSKLSHRGCSVDGGRPPDPAGGPRR
jgi:hypothetical protein